MSTKLKSINNNPKIARLLSVGKVLSITAFAQLLIQIIGLVCGILIIRNFTIKEYSWYTLSNTMLGAMNILADGGIVLGVMSEGGKVWQDKNKLGSVINTGLKLRKKFALFSILACGSVLIFLLMRNGAAWCYSILVLLCIIPTFYANLTDSMYEVGPKLHQQLNAVQVNQMKANLGRLLLTFSTVFIFPFTSVALLVVGLPRIIANIKLKKIAAESVDFNAETIIETEKQVLTSVKRILPLSIYNIFSVQITIWVLSFFGSTLAIAQAGALFRIGTILTVFQMICTMVIVPRLARMKSDKAALLKAFLQSHLFMVAMFLMIVLAGYLFSGQIIWLFGKNYKGLNHELVLTIIIFCLNVFQTIQYNINATRNWILNPLVVIGVNLVSIIISAFIFDLKFLQQVLIMNIVVSTVLLLLTLAFGYYKLAKLENI